jgi:hypothetical protein
MFWEVKSEARRRTFPPRALNALPVEHKDVVSAGFDQLLCFEALHCSNSRTPDAQHQRQDGAMVRLTKRKSPALGCGLLDKSLSD